MLDVALPVAVGVAVAAFADLRHVILPEAGHMLHHDQPEALAQVLEGFLSG